MPFAKISCFTCRWFGPTEVQETLVNNNDSGVGAPCTLEIQHGSFDKTSKKMCSATITSIHIMYIYICIFHYNSIDSYQDKTSLPFSLSKGWNEIYPIKLLSFWKILTSRTGIDLNKVGPGGNHTWHTSEMLPPPRIPWSLRQFWPWALAFMVSTWILAWNELSVSSWIWPTNQLQYMTLFCEWFFPLAFNIGICSWWLFCNMANPYQYWTGLMPNTCKDGQRWPSHDVPGISPQKLCQQRQVFDIPSLVSLRSGCFFCPK